MIIFIIDYSRDYFQDRFILVDHNFPNPSVTSSDSFFCQRMINQYFKIVRQLILFQITGCFNSVYAIIIYLQKHQFHIDVFIYISSKCWYYNNHCVTFFCSHLLLMTCQKLDLLIAPHLHSYESCNELSHFP